MPGFRLFQMTHVRIICTTLRPTLAGLDGTKKEPSINQHEVLGVQKKYPDLMTNTCRLDTKKVRYKKSTAPTLEQLGRMLKYMDMNKGTQGQLKGRNSSGGTKKEPPEDDAPTLADLGLDKKKRPGMSRPIQTFNDRKSYFILFNPLTIP